MLLITTAVAMDVASLGANIASGNVGGALLDAGGLVVDALATVIPVVPGGAGAAIKAGRAADKARDVLKANKAMGERGEKMVADKLGDQVAGKQVTFKTSDGTRTRADIVTKDKGTVEVKTGNGKLRPGQQKLQDDINAGRNVTPVGQNARDAGLTPGQPTRMNSCSLERVNPC